MGAGLTFKSSREFGRKIRKDAKLELDGIVSGVKKAITGYLDKASPEDTGYLKNNWEVTVTKSGAVSTSSINFVEGKTNVIKIKVVIRNRAKYFGILRGDYTQRGNQLLLAYPKPAGKLHVVAVFNIDSDGGNRDKKPQVHTGGDERSTKLMRIVTIPKKTIYAKSGLRYDLNNNLERQVYKYLWRKLKLSKFFVGQIEVEFVSGYKPRGREKGKAESK